MAQKAYFVGPYESGLAKDVRPWLLADQAFAYLRNAYVWRGILKKRIGSRLFKATTDIGEQLASRLRILINTTDGTGAATQAGGAIPGAVVGANCIGQMFSIGDELFTVQAVGTPVTMLKTGATATATYDTTTLAYTFAGATINTSIYWYPALPVMGLMNYEDIKINDETAVAFDTRFAYYRTAGAWERLGTLVWAGSNSQFFWGVNHRGALSYNYLLFVVNYNRADQICHWDGTTFVRTTFSTKANDVGAILAANFILQSARLIVSFKERLVALNTLESVDDGAGNPVEVSFTSRARWCSPASPFNANSWQDDVAAGGQWADCPTREAIITARIIQDRLIVYFERSTWELVYTANILQPFLWQSIDDSVGAESTFSSVIADGLIYGVGQSGVYSCDGNKVTRIDEKIPDEVFKIHNGNDGVNRVAGIRDYVSELIYWTFPSSKHNTTYPDRLMVYNYKNKAWAFFDDSITAFGYAQNETDDTWEGDLGLWQDDTSTWNTGADQSLYRNVIAGNQQGFTFVMDKEVTRNAPSLQITNVDITTIPGSIIFTVINHNFVTAELINKIIVEHVQGMTNINDRVFTVMDVAATTITVAGDAENPVTGVYTGGGVISRVSEIAAKTKRFNFFSSAVRAAMTRIEFDLDKTDSGLLYVNFLPSTSQIGIGKIVDGLMTDFKIEMYPYATDLLETGQTQLVRRIYPFAEGDSIQLLLFTNFDDFDTGYFDATSPFTLNSMTFYASPTATR